MRGRTPSEAVRFARLDLFDHLPRFLALRRDLNIFS